MYKSNYYIGCFFQILVLITLYSREYALLLFPDAAITSVLYYAFIVLTAFWIFISLFSTERVRTNTWIVLVYLLLIGIILYTSFIGYNLESKETNESIGRIIALLLFYCISFRQIVVSELIIRINTFLNSILAIMLFALSFSSAMYLRGDLVYSYLNPNSTGLVALLTFYSIFLGLKYVRGRISKFVVILSMMGSLYILIKSTSRSPIIALLLFIVVFYVLKIWKKQGYQYKSIWLLCCQLFAVFYPLLWVALYKIISNKTIVLLGKPLFTSRELIWNYMYSVLSFKPIASHLGESFVYGSGPHNAFLSVWWAYGFMAFICFHLIIYFMYRNLNRRIYTYEDSKIVMILISFLVSMSFEALLFSGGVNFTFRAFFLAFFLRLNKEGVVIQDD